MTLVTIPIDEEAAKALERVARRSRRSPEAVAAQAFELALSKVKALFCGRPPSTEKAWEPWEELDRLEAENRRLRQETMEWGQRIAATRYEAAQVFNEVMTLGIRLGGAEGRLVMLAKMLQRSGEGMEVEPVSIEGRDEILRRYLFRIPNLAGSAQGRSHRGGASVIGTMPIGHRGDEARPNRPPGLMASAGNRWVHALESPGISTRSWREGRAPP